MGIFLHETIIPLPIHSIYTGGAMKTQSVTRFAPSPTGLLHIGHAVSAWFAWEHGDVTLLRIEDIDNGRCRPSYIDAIYEDLQWLGLDWPQPVRKQSEHFDEYRLVLTHLDDQGLLYPCFCTRKDIADEIARAPSAPHGPEGIIYPRTCRHLSIQERSERINRGDAYALRLDMTAAVKRTGPLHWHDRTKGKQDVMTDYMIQHIGDVVLARKDTPVSYHLCVTHDDAQQNITLVTRGDDLFFATPIHRILQSLLGYPVPEYHHHPLLTDAQGKKFSKRDKSLTIQTIRNKGFSAAQLKDMIANRSFERLLSL